MKMTISEAHKRKERGFSLLEVMVAMLILAIGILGLAPTFVLSISANSISNQSNQANLVAQERLEHFLMAVIPTNFPFTETLTGVGGKYDVTTVITTNANDNTIPVGLYQLHVTVAWNDQDNRAHNLHYYTYRE